MVSFRHVRAARAILVVCLGLAPASAMAQPAAPSNDAEAAMAEVNRDYASALAADCTMACQALDSMRRATEHLCTLDAGDRCATARQKLADATAHVRAACPACGGELRDETNGTKPGPPPLSPVPKEAPPPPATVNAAEEAQVSKRGGCAGCATSGPAGGDVAPLGVAVIGLLALRRRRAR